MKVFSLNTEQGIADAEEYRESLYKHYDTVKINSVGFDIIQMWGEDGK